jgi:hypothetical protein
MPNKITIDFNFTFKTLDGKDFLFNGNTAFANSALADTLQTTVPPKGLGAAYLAWTYDLYKTGQITVDEKELQAFKEFVDNAGFITVAYGGILEAIKKAEDAVKPN